MGHLNRKTCVITTWHFIFFILFTNTTIKPGCYRICMGLLASSAVQIILSFLARKEYFLYCDRSKWWHKSILFQNTDSCTCHTVSTKISGDKLSSWNRLFMVIDPIVKTRMHSSRMRTGRSLTVCCSLFPGGGGGVFLPAGGGGGSLPGPGGVLCLVPGGSPENPPC